MTSKLTAKQRRMLEILSRYSDSGYCELELQWGEYASRTDREEDMTGFWTTHLVVRNLIRSLIRRGLAEELTCPRITDLGIKELECAETQTD